MIEPHGGKLVDRIVSSTQAEYLLEETNDSAVIPLDTSHYQDLINISNGRYSPIDGFLGQNDFAKVVHDMTLEDGTRWPIPIILDVNSDLAGNLVTGEKARLKGPSGEFVGVIQVSDIYQYNRSEVAIQVFGTDDTDHPGVSNLYDRDNFLVGGKVLVFGENRYNETDLLPKETRVLFEYNGWDTVVGFQTRNAPHRAHEYIQKSALELVDGLLVQPKLGDKKVGDYQDSTILDAYHTLLNNYYPDDCTALTVFPSKMNYAGPREAVFDALVRKNQGCSHFIVGRDHAGVGDYYDSYAAQNIFKEIEDIGITPLFYNYSFYCEKCDGMASEKICAHDESDQVHPSGTTIRNLIKDGELPSEKMMRPEVAQDIMDADTPFVQKERVAPEGGMAK